MDEILKGKCKLEDLPSEIQDNLWVLVGRINIIRQAYGKPMKVNDGIRLAGTGPAHGAKQSNHYKGAAIDIDDNDAGDLWFWLMKPEQMRLLKDIGLWLEHGNWTHNKKYGTWVHFQIFPPKSGKRIYIPSAEPDPNPKFWNGKYDVKYD